MYKTMLVLVGFVGCSPFLDSDASLVKPRLERSKVNKGVWLRKNRQDPFVKSSLGSFILRANSFDVESQVQNGFDVFSSKQDGIASGYMDRYKREPHSTTNHRPRKSLNNKTIHILDSPASLLNEYTYEVTAVRDSTNNKNIDYNVYTKAAKVPHEKENYIKNATTEGNFNDKEEKTKQNTDKEKQMEHLRDITNSTGENMSIPKRSMNYATDIDRINLLDVRNTNSKAIENKYVNDERAWQITPVTDVVYEIVPKTFKEDVRRPKPVSEKGLIKVLSMLTKTFKKIMKQHSDIKVIHDQINLMNEGCKINIEKHSKRLEDFDTKYTFFLKIMEKFKILQDKLKAKEDGYKKKEEEMSKYLLKLEGQQKTFLLQQQQFFKMQKLMLAQNEKINQNQNAIAKTQSEIALRQNNFTRVLEKAKKIYMEAKQPKLTTTIANRKHEPNNYTEEKKTYVMPSTTTESVKINLFSVPSAHPILNQDELILREINEKPVDDVIYKYYFNNTFIDTIIKNKILPGFFIADKTAIARNAKQKRNKHKASVSNSRTSTTGDNVKLGITMLLPVYNDTKADPTLRRERRWINHHSNKRHRRKHHGKGKLINQPLYLNEVTNVNKEIKTTLKPVKVDSVINDPFLNMAIQFCNEIGQNSTKQILNWCMEKALRRLKSLDTKLVLPQDKVQETSRISTRETTYFPTQTPTRTESTNTFKIIITEAPATSTYTTPIPTSTRGTPKTTTLAEFNAFFPGNDELETNLKQFDLTPDTVGNVYYEGSLHASDVVGDKSDPLSDFLPGFDSNSRVDADTTIMELQSLRQFHNQRMRSNIFRKQKRRQ